MIKEGVLHELRDLAADALEEEKAERDAKLQQLASLVIKKRTSRYFKRYNCLILRLSKTSSCAFVPEGGKLRKSIVFDFVQTIVSLIDSVLLSLVKVKSILRFQWDGATVTFQRASSLLLAKTRLCVALR